MLRGTDNGVYLLGLHRSVCPLQVLEGHLRLAIGAQLPQQTTFADIRQLISKVRSNEFVRACFLGLAACVPKHDALIVSTHVHMFLPT